MMRTIHISSITPLVQPGCAHQWRRGHSTVPHTSALYSMALTICMGAALWTPPYSIQSNIYATPCCTAHSSSAHITTSLLAPAWTSRQMVTLCILVSTIQFGYHVWCCTSNPPYCIQILTVCTIALPHIYIFTALISHYSSCAHLTTSRHSSGCKVTSPVQSPACMQRQQ